MTNGRQERPKVLALHGFTLGGLMFSELDRIAPARIVAPDLPGHGGRGPANTSWDDAVAEVAAVAATNLPAAVLGYSMGGRLAIGAALSRPDLFPRLLVVAASAGIADAAKRRARREADLAGAAVIEDSGVAAYVDEFASNPLLQAPDAAVDLRAMRHANDAIGLAAALRGMGQGSQPPLFERLPELEMPVVWMAGDRDPTYLSIAERAAAACPRGQSLIVPAAHNVIAERPGDVAKALAALMQ